MIFRYINNPIDFFGNVTRANSLLSILAYLVAITFAICMHEFAHAFSAVKCGDNTPRDMGRLTINPAVHLTPLGLISLVIVGFGWGNPVIINPNNFNNEKRGRTITSLAGVMTNFVLSFLFLGIYYLFFYLGSQHPSNIRALQLLIYFLTAFAYFSFQINITLCVFNFLPIYPLDGFKLIKANTKPGNKFVVFMEKNGTKIFFGLIALSLISSFLGIGIIDILGTAIQIVDNFFLLLFSLFWSLFI